MTLMSSKNTHMILRPVSKRAYYFNGRSFLKWRQEYSVVSRQTRKPIQRRVAITKLLEFESIDYCFLSKINI